MMPVRFAVNPGWMLILRDLNIRPENVMRHGGLPDDLLTQPQSTVSADEYCRVFRGLEAEADYPGMPIDVAEAVSFESFDPPLFAAMCSSDLNLALSRLSRFKPLCAPMALHVDVGAHATVVEVEWLEPTCTPPSSMIAIELTFLVRLARLATRTRVVPLRVTADANLLPADRYSAYFGVPVENGGSNSLTFSAADAARPFLTGKQDMWQFFEPELRKRLAGLEVNAPIGDRVRNALLELLPSGRTTVRQVAIKLGMSPRTLQRRLRSDGVSFQTALNGTREQLARHYLATSEMSGAEISYLLGYEDPNSFFRAFQSWTGQTPENTRTALRARG